MSNHSFLVRDPEKSGYVENTEAFVVNWSALFVNTVVAVGVNFLDGGTLRKLEGIDNSVDFGVSAPVNKVGEHDLHLCKVELSGATEPKEVVVVEV